MGADEKFDNKAQEVRGKVKKAVGRAIDDPDLEARGRADQARADIKQAAEKVKDAFRR
jgi:uncharacterized protein YjbJ (UPF0337 family)